MKKILIFAIFVLCVISIYIYIDDMHSNIYIFNNNDIEYGIKKYFSNKGRYDVNISVKKVVDIENKKMVVGLINNKLVFKAEFELGSFKRYRLIGFGYGYSKPYRYNIIETSSGRFLVVMGINYDLQIKNIEVNLNKTNKVGYTDEYQENFKVPIEEFYIVYKQLDQPNIFRYKINQIVLKNAKNEDITKKIRDIHKSSSNPGL